MNKLARFMEHFWLAVAIGTAIAAAWVTVQDGVQAGLQWWVFPAVALAMFFFRKFTRKRLEAMGATKRSS
jgi:Na+/phosphate symporter